MRLWEAIDLVTKDSTSAISGPPKVLFPPNLHLQKYLDNPVLSLSLPPALPLPISFSVSSSLLYFRAFSHQYCPYTLADFFFPIEFSCFWLAASIVLRFCPHASISVSSPISRYPDSFSSESSRILHGDWAKERLLFCCTDRADSMGIRIVIIVSVF